MRVAVKEESRRKGKEIKEMMVRGKKSGEETRGI